LDQIVHGSVILVARHSEGFERPFAGAQQFRRAANQIDHGGRPATTCARIDDQIDLPVEPRKGEVIEL
jgi:hypothetical protein